MPALHLSCHGHNAWRPPKAPAGPPGPVLFLEDGAGDPLPTDAPALLGHLKPAPPRLLFLSACLSAAAGGGEASWPGGDTPPVRAGAVSHSLATALVTGGLPAVLGWEGSVADRSATRFAAVFYAEAAKGLDLAEAVADARRALLGAEDDVIRADWHLARLWLGPAGGGPLATGRRKRSMLPATHGHRVFLDRKQRVPVAAPEMFVGRRRVVQDALRALDDRTSAGVLLHGIGRVGKSSAAARIASRRKDELALAVMVNRYDALAVVEALDDGLRAVPAARALLEAGRPRVRDQARHLEPLLSDLLTGPCCQRGDGAQPVLLVVDDLEQILEEAPTEGRHRVREAEHATVLAMLLRAFDPTRTDSRLLLTSRFPFRLHGLEDRLHAIHLGALSETERAMLQLRQEQAATIADAGRRLSEADLRVRAPLLDRARAVARGNPGLQDLIGRQLVLSAAVPVATAEATLSEMEAWLAGGDLPAEPEVRAFLENLALDRLLGLAGNAGRDLLRAAAWLGGPVPRAVLEAMAGDIGGEVARLEGLGLLEPAEDRVDPRIPARATNDLAAGRLPPLTEAESTSVAAIALPALLDAWGGLTAEPDWPTAADLQVARLGLAADDADAVGACATGAMGELAKGHAGERARFGQACIALLDCHRCVFRGI